MTDQPTRKLQKGDRTKPVVATEELLRMGAMNRDLRAQIVELTQERDQWKTSYGALSAATVASVRNQVHVLSAQVEAVRAAVADIEADVAADDWRAEHGRLTVGRWLYSLKSALDQTQPRQEQPTT